MSDVERFGASCGRLGEPLSGNELIGWKENIDIRGRTKCLVPRSLHFSETLVNKNQV